MSEAKPGKLKVRCPCGAKMLLPAEAAGRKAKCPKCAKVFRVPAAPPGAAQAKPPGAAQAKPPKADGGDSLLDELAQMEQSAQALTTPDSTGDIQACPQCGAGIPSRAALCVSCGYNRETGRALKGAGATPGALQGLVRALSGSFVLGCVLSGLGGLVGAIAWVLIAIITKYEIAWVAIGLGALAGFGMTLGYRERNSLAGVAAAGTSVVAILLAKMMVFVFVVYAVFTGNTSDRDLQREFVKVRITEDILVERDVFTDEERDEQWESAYAEADKRVSGMSDEQLADRLKEIRQEQEFQFANLEEVGPERYRLASHRVELRAMELGLSYEDEARSELYEEELTRSRALSEDEVAEATADLEAWEKAGKWSDDAYVRNHLIYQLIDREIAERTEEAEEGYWETTPEEWTQRFEAARAEVDALSPEQRVERSRLIDTEIEEEISRETLAWHHMARRAESLGISYDSPKREALHEEEFARAEKLSGEKLEAAVAEMRAWEDEGKWSDEEYVRDHLIYQHIDQMIDEHRADAGNDEEYWQPDEEQWRSFYDEAVARVDAIPESERAARSRDLEADRIRRLEERLEQQGREEMAAATGEMVGVFFASSFQPLDALFFFLAVAVAYQIASGRRKQ